MVNFDNISEKMRLFRAEHNLTQVEFAEISGISYMTVRETEGKKRKPSVKTVGKMIRIMKKYKE